MTLTGSDVRAIHNLRGRVIVSCGEAVVDLVPEVVPGGGPLNVAVAASRLGAPAAFVGRISTDAYGDLIVNHLRANGGTVVYNITTCLHDLRGLQRAVGQQAFAFMASQ